MFKLMDLQDYYQIVEDAIQMLDVDPVSCRGQVAGEWTLQNGTQEVWVDLWEIEQEKRPYFQVLAPMMVIPVGISPAFYRDLLEINYNLYGVGFSINNNQLHIKVIREAEGLDAREAHAMILRVGTYAKDYGEELRQKYFNDNAGPGAVSDL